jgi:hypothetical protein
LNLFEFDPEFPEFWVSRGVPKFFLSQKEKTCPQAHHTSHQYGARMVNSIFNVPADIKSLNGHAPIT